MIGESIHDYFTVKEGLGWNLQGMLWEKQRPGISIRWRGSGVQKSFQEELAFNEISEG